MTDGHDSRPFRLTVVRRRDEHRLPHVPIRGIELQHDRAVAFRPSQPVLKHVSHEVGIGRYQHRVTQPRRVLLILLGTRGTDRDINLRPGSYGDRQSYEIGIQRAPLATGRLANQGCAVGLIDDDVAAESAPATTARQARDVEIDPRSNQPVITQITNRRHFVVDEAALPVDFLRRHDIRDIARDIEQIVADSTDHASGHASRRALNREVIVPFQSIEFEDFDMGVSHIHAATVHTLIGDHEIVAKFSTQHQHLVESTATVDRHRRVQAIFNEVVARPALNGVGRGGRAATLANCDSADVSLDRPVGVRFGECECTHNKQVVPVVAFHSQRGLIAVNLEDVVTASTCRDQRSTRTTTEISACRRDGVEDVVRRDVRATVSLAAEHLTDLESVIAGTTVERGDRTVIIDREVIVAAVTVNRQTAIQVGIVVDPFKFHRAAARLCQSHVAMQQRDKRGRFGDFAWNRDHSTQQEHVIAGLPRRRIDTPHDQFIHAIGFVAGVEHIDHIVVSIGC